MKRLSTTAATRVVAAVCALLGATLVVGALPAARDAKAPRIVAAVMQDVDGDARADRLRLVYSETVRHAADRDGRFPFRVAGYRFRSVGRASGKRSSSSSSSGARRTEQSDLSCGTAGRPSSRCSTGAGTRRCVSCFVARGRTGRARLPSLSHSHSRSPSRSRPLSRP